MNIVFDIGGTNMRVATAVGDVLGEIRKVPTPQDSHEGIRLLATLAKELAVSGIERAAGDISGRFDSDGALYDAKNIRLWEGVRIAHEVSVALGVPVQVANDAVVVGYGELVNGAGKGFSDIAYITVSTGVGGAFIKTGDIATSPLLCELTLKIGDLEPLISGTAVRKKFGIAPKDLESLEERNKLADILAAGLEEIAAVWKPQAFVIGGSMIVGMNPIPLERVRERFSAVPVKMAELGDNGGLIGGALLAAASIPPAVE